MGSTSPNIRPAEPKRADSQQDQISEDNNSSPPPYADEQGGTVPKKRVDIKATDIPQWAWTNEECREWITLMLEKGGEERGDAEALAKNFEGFGPNLWLNTHETYFEWIGASGEAIYALLMEVRNAKGAVPQTVSIAHYEK